MTTDRREGLTLVAALLVSGTLGSAGGYWWPTGVVLWPVALVVLCGAMIVIKRGLTRPSGA